MVSRASNAKALWQRGDGATPEVFTSVAEVRRVGEINFSQKFAETTNTDSGDWEEFIDTLKSAGSVDVEVNLLSDDVTQDDNTGVVADFLSSPQSKRNYRMVMSNQSSRYIQLPGFVENVKIGEGQQGSAMVMTFTFKFSGAPTIGW